MAIVGILVTGMGQVVPELLDRLELPLARRAASTHWRDAGRGWEMPLEGASKVG
jgi:hypothetical protein